MHNCRAASVITAEPPAAKLESGAEQPEEREINTTFARHKTTSTALPTAGVGLPSRLRDGSGCPSDPWLVPIKGSRALVGAPAVPLLSWGFSGPPLLAGSCTGSRVTVNFIVLLLCGWGGLLGDP